MRSQKRRRSGNSAMRPWMDLAEAADETGEIADPRRQHRLDALAHAARHHRRSAAGADGDTTSPRSTMAGKDEGGMREVVHHIDGKADRLGARRHRNADIAGAGAEDRDDAGKIGRQRIALRMLDLRRIVGIEPAQIMIAVGRVPADARTGRREQAQFRARKIARANQQHRTGFADRGRRAGIACDTRFPHIRG